ncbi:MAG: hypothetical protein JWM93_3153 [Frankiales bacterium]|nr:hypothetical protein [Frankiales bacterium]
MGREVARVDVDVNALIARRSRRRAVLAASVVAAFAAAGVGLAMDLQDEPDSGHLAASPSEATSLSPSRSTPSVPSVPSSGVSPATAAMDPILAYLETSQWTERFQGARYTSCAYAGVGEAARNVFVKAACTNGVTSTVTDVTLTVSREGDDLAVVSGWAPHVGDEAPPVTWPAAAAQRSASMDVDPLIRAMEDRHRTK